MRYGLIGSLFAYLRAPGLRPIAPAPSRPVLLIARLTLICLAAATGARLLGDLLVSRQLIAAPGPSFLEQPQVSLPEFMLGAVLIAPLTEELVFRAQLRRFSASLFFIAFIFGLLLSALTGTRWALLISPVLFVLFFSIYRLTLGYSLTSKFTFWRRLFPLHFYLTAVCFALVHLGNFEKGISLLPLGLFYTLPQLAIGLVLGYTRMNYGFRYAVYLHSIYNLVLAAVLYFRW